MKTGVIRYHHFLGSQRILIADADAMKHILVTNASNYLRPHFLVGYLFVSAALYICFFDRLSSKHFTLILSYHP